MANEMDWSDYTDVEMLNIVNSPVNEEPIEGLVRLIRATFDLEPTADTIADHVASAVSAALHRAYAIHDGEELTDIDRSRYSRYTSDLLDGVGSRLLLESRSIDRNETYRG